MRVRVGTTIRAQLFLTCFLSYASWRFALTASLGGSWAGPSQGGSRAGPLEDALVFLAHLQVNLQNPALNGRVSPKVIPLTLALRLT
jgi:hypothetical protein